MRWIACPFSMMMMAEQVRRQMELLAEGLEMVRLTDSGRMGADAQALGDRVAITQHGTARLAGCPGCS
jgi:hypothetical protein